MSRAAALILVTGCASAGGSDVPATTDAAIDAPITIDAPRPDSSSSGTCASPFTGTLATWTFTSETGSQAMTAVATKATGITAGAVTRSAGLTAVSGAGSINASNWPTAAQRDLTKYYALAIAPPAGCTLTITTANVDARASGTGPVSAVLSTSADTYAQTSPISTTAATAASVAIANASSMVELRIYGYAASASGGTLRLQTSLSLVGSLQ